VVAQVSNELVEMLSQDSKLNITTIELLGKGFELWAPRNHFQSHHKRELAILSLKLEPSHTRHFFS
jgi:hypothetical protein